MIKGIDLFHGKSPKAFKNAVSALVSVDKRVFPEDAKGFSAIMSMQGFDGKPNLANADLVSTLKEMGHTEVFRGIHSSGDGTPVSLYATALLSGQPHPGLQAAYGHGIYFAEVSKDPNTSREGHGKGFEACSKIAWEYASKQPPGIILRAVIDPHADTRDLEDIEADFPQYENRAIKMGIEDFGSFAVAVGIDAYYTDRLEERIWVVFNRTILTFQTTVLQIPADSLKLDT